MFGTDPDPSVVPAATARARTPAPSGPRTVTLITGDQVRLDPASQHIAIFPGPGRASIAFSVHRQRDQVTVIPSDVAASVADDELDRALFDVSALIADGFADDERADLPLIVTGVDGPTAMQPRLASAGLTAAHALPALHMMAVRQAKASGGAAKPACARSRRASAAPPSGRSGSTPSSTSPTTTACPRSRVSDPHRWTMRPWRRSSTPAVRPSPDSGYSAQHASPPARKRRIRCVRGSFQSR